MLHNVLYDTDYVKRQPAILNVTFRIKWRTSVNTIWHVWPYSLTQRPGKKPADGGRMDLEQPRRVGGPSCRLSILSCGFQPAVEASASDGVRRCAPLRGRHPIRLLVRSRRYPVRWFCGFKCWIDSAREARNLGSSTFMSLLLRFLRYY